MLTVYVCPQMEWMYHQLKVIKSGKQATGLQSILHKPVADRSHVLSLETWIIALETLAIFDVTKL